jgi:hypothetical protein
MEDVGVEREAGASATRRVAMRRLSLAAMAIVGGVAKLTASADPAWAYTYYCCTLAKPHSPGCMYNCWRYAGYAAYSWTCWYGSTQYWCGECTTGTSCWNGTFLCSEYGQM